MTEGTTEDWGRLAVSLPGWRWMPGMLAKPLGYRALRVDGEGRTWGVCQDEQTDQNPWPFAWDWLPDPDDPATAGCLLALLGSLKHGSRAWYYEPEGDWSARVLDRPTGRVIECAGGWQASLGRACIAAAEALGRWPGGEG